ncbi:MAG: electron transport complex subunit RsxC [bacterium]
MKVYTFRKGGVHAEPAKALTASLPIRQAPLPRRVILPLAMHTGAPAVPVVEPKDQVKTGQLIAEARAQFSAPVHASITGRVVALENHIHPLGGELPAIILESGGEDHDEWDPAIRPHLDWRTLPSHTLRQMIRDAGIVGLGGAAFPTHIKLTPPEGKGVEILIINGVECEPYLTADHRLMLERSKQILQGVSILQKILGVSKTFVAIEDNKPDAIDRMVLASKEAEDIGQMAPEVVAVRTKYPQGSEKQLIEAITKRQVPIGGLPLDVGVVIQNVGTAAAVAEAVIRGVPLIQRVVTVTGRNIRQPGNFQVRIGTPVADLIALAGGYWGRARKIIMGGPMMGVAVFTDQVPVIKGTSGILVPHEKEIRAEQPRPCIRCGKCLKVCPMRLLPGRFIDFIEGKELDEAQKKHIFNCMECGACTYVCPAHRPIVQWVKFGKAQIRRKKTQRVQK